MKCVHCGVANASGSDVICEECRDAQRILVRHLSSFSDVWQAARRVMRSGESYQKYWDHTPEAKVIAATLAALEPVWPSLDAVHDRLTTEHQTASKTVENAIMGKARTLYEPEEVS